MISRLVHIVTYHRFSESGNSKVRFMFYKETMNSKRLIAFSTKLTKYAERKLFLVLDNLKVHNI